MIHNLGIARNLYSLYKEYSTSLTDLIDRSVTNTLFDSHDNHGLNLMDDTEDDENPKTAKSSASKHFKGMKKVDLMTEKLTTLCRKMIKDIEKFYENSKYKNAILQFKHMDQEEFVATIYTATFSGKSDDPSIQAKQRVLNFYIKSYQDVKNEYLDRDEGSNLISFFDKNRDNLMGVFSSCIDRIYEITKKQRRDKNSKALAKDLGTNRFWMN